MKSYGILFLINNFKKVASNSFKITLDLIKTRVKENYKVYSVIRKYVDTPILYECFEYEFEFMNNEFDKIIGKIDPNEFDNLKKKFEILNEELINEKKMKI